jgi:hypothetical protein
MMSTRKYFPAAVSLVLVFFFGCADLMGSETPSEVVKAVYTAANEGNSVEVEKRLSAPDPAAIEMIGIIASDGKQQQWKPSVKPGTLQSVEILSEEKTTYRATVSFRLHLKNGKTREMQVQLLKEAGYWKILR